MYRVDADNKTLIEIPVTDFSSLNLKERFDIQEWIERIFCLTPIPLVFSCFFFISLPRMNVQAWTYTDNHSLL
jgi:hypothetical protein